jgi:hypothetical protein
VGADAHVDYGGVAEDDENPSAKPVDRVTRGGGAIQIGPGLKLYLLLMALIQIGILFMETPLGYTLWTRQKEMDTIMESSAKLMGSVAGERERIVYTLRSGTQVANRLIRVFGKMDTAAMDRAVASMSAVAETMGDPSVHGTMAAALDFFSGSSASVRQVAGSVSTATDQFTRVLNAFSTALQQEEEARKKINAVAPP